MSLWTEWSETIRARFGEREPLGWDEAYTRHWSAFPKRDVFEVFELIETEYGLPAGILRPEDPTAFLFEPVQISNPLKWLFFQSRSEDTYTEMDHQLTKRLRARAQSVDSLPVSSLGAYVRAWSIP